MCHRVTKGSQKTHSGTEWPVLREGESPCIKAILMQSVKQHLFSQNLTQQYRDVIVELLQ